MSPRDARRPSRSFVGLLLLTGLACSAVPRREAPQKVQLEQAVASPERLTPVEPLSEGARATLKTRMAHHAEDMAALVSAIMLLQYPQIRDGAARIAEDSSLSRPLSADAAALAAALPEGFFVHQEALRREARTLVDAASRQNALDVADSYGRLSQACVRCHATYRAGH